MNHQRGTQSAIDEPVRSWVFSDMRPAAAALALVVALIFCSTAGDALSPQAAAAAAAAGNAARAGAAPAARVAVVGAGIGGAAAATYLLDLTGEEVTVEV
jgi:hypothetical protein